MSKAIVRFAVGSVLAAASCGVHAQQPAHVLSTSFGSGHLNLPNGEVLRDGETIFGWSNVQEADFRKFVKGNQYQFGIGLFDWVELTGRLSEYPKDHQGTLGVRDLSASIKLAVPKLLRWQPDIAIGINDVAGGAPYFRSHYVVVSHDFEAVQVSAGVAKGARYLDGPFASVQVPLGRSRFFVIGDYRRDGSSIGGRYQSGAMPWLSNAQLTLAVQRTFDSDRVELPAAKKYAASVQLAFPLGQNASNPRRIALADEPIWIPPSTPSGSAEHAAASAHAPAKERATPTPAVPGAAAPGLAQQLKALGLERVQVGRRDREVVVVYENHRYQQNEVDALGIVLGSMAFSAQGDVQTITAVVKKAGIPIYSVSVPASSYREFLRKGETAEGMSGLQVAYSPRLDNVEFDGIPAGAHSRVRFRLEPSLVKFLGTDLGVVDYSLAARVSAFAPLWAGAELHASALATLEETQDVIDGVLNVGRQPNGLNSFALSQAFWVAPRVLNVTTVGKLFRDHKGVQNELTWFVPGRDDQVRWAYSHMQRPKGMGSESFGASSASYLFKYEPFQADVELSYSFYRYGDRGPSLIVSRWLGDVQAQVSVRSGAETKIGFGLVFPLTPRQGPKSMGGVQLEGTSSFLFRAETKYAQRGQCNCLRPQAVEELPLAYPSRGELLNQSRVGRQYFIAQLQRMREALFIYAPAAVPFQ